MGWANHAHNTTINELFSTQGSGSQQFWVASGGSNVVWQSASGSSQTWTAAWPGLNQWVHWALTYNDTTKVAELYINGVSQGTKTLTTAYTSNGAFRLGVSSSASWDGNMQEAAVFESIVSAANVLAIYNAGVGGVG
jgi:hypothetical protein